MCRIIYQHEYSSIDTDETEEEMEESASDNNHLLPYEEFEKKFLKDRQLLLDNTRIYGKRDFIRAAIDLSEWYELDVLILEHESHISVELTFDYCVSMNLFKPLFLQADEITIMQGKQDHQITLSLDYYTHYVIRNGQVVRP